MSKNVTTDDLAGGMIRARFGKKLYVKGSEAVTFDPDECEVLLDLMFHRQGRLSETETAIVHKLGKAKVQGLVRKGLGLT